MYLTFCGIGITNAKLFELSAKEFNRNRVNRLKQFIEHIQVEFSTLKYRNNHINYNFLKYDRRISCFIFH